MCALFPAGTGPACWSVQHHRPAPYAPCAAPHRGAAGPGWGLTSAPLPGCGAGLLTVCRYRWFGGCGLLRRGRVRGGGGGAGAGCGGEDAGDGGHHGQSSETTGRELGDHHRRKEGLGLKVAGRRREEPRGAPQVPPDSPPAGRRPGAHYRNHLHLRTSLHARHARDMPDRFREVRLAKMLGFRSQMGGQLRHPCYLQDMKDEEWTLSC